MRFFEETDYTTFCEWRKEHNVPAIPYDALPFYGLVVDDVCMCFLYRTDSSVVGMDFLVTNPKADLKRRIQSIEEVITGLNVIAQELGYKYTVASVTRPGLNKILKRLNFIKTGNSTNFVRSL